MSTVSMRVESLPPDKQKIYEELFPDECFTTEQFLFNRCHERMELIKELSHELVEVRRNYEEVLRRLNKYEPTEELPERQYEHQETEIRWG